MELGCAVPVSGSWATPEACAEVASFAEALGYRSLWTFQRLLAPVDKDGADRLEPQYRSVEDPLAMLAYLAATTTSARLGVAVLNAPFYSPIVLAKPLQRPHPPLLLGGTANAALRRAGRMADGWISSSRADLSDLTRSIGVVRAAAFVDLNFDPLIGSPDADPEVSLRQARTVLEALAPRAR